MTEILIVDDEPLVAEMLTLRLNLHGYSIHTAENGLDAIAKTRDFSPDLILMDIQMPVMNGLDAVKALRGSGYEGVIVAITAAARSQDLETAREVGCDGCITKPIDQEFEARIDEYLKGGRA